MFTACSEDKDAEVTPIGKLNKVTFNTNALTSTISDLKTVPATPVFSRYDYILYKQDGTFVKVIKFDTTELSDELEAGDYHVQIIAHDLSGSYGFEDPDKTGEYFWSPRTTQKSTTGIFTGKADFSVVNDVDTNVSVELKRISCGLKLNFTDLSEKRLVRVSINDVPYKYFVNTGETEDYTLRDMDIYTTSTVQFLSKYVTTRSQFTASVELKLFNADNNIFVKTITLDNVTFQTNCITTISGNILGTETKSLGFDVTADDAWGSPIQVIF